jgi:hypothetical protein
MSSPSKFTTHLAVHRLLALCSEAIITEPEECRHLVECDLCMSLLRQYAEERRRDLLAGEELKKLKSA